MPAPALVLDTLQSLLDAEQASIFRFMREGTPYLTRATVDTRKQIEQMAAASDRHAAALADLITSLGGLLRPEPVHPAGRERDHVLRSAAELDADDVVVHVDAERA